MKLKLKKHNYCGKLIVFEGTDGAGKTTMIELTREYLSGKIGEENIILTKQPTDMSRNTKLFQKMMYCKNHEDIDYRAVQLLTMSDRIQHSFEKIIPALKLGKTVICDRYIYTSLANMEARGYLKERWFFQTAHNLIKPNIAFLAYAEPFKAIERIKSRPNEYRRHLDEELLRRVAANFLRMKKQYNFVQLDTFKESQQAFEKVRTELDNLYSETEKWIGKI